MPDAELKPASNLVMRGGRQILMSAEAIMDDSEGAALGRAAASADAKFRPLSVYLNQDVTFHRDWSIKGVVLRRQVRNPLHHSASGATDPRPPSLKRWSQISSGICFTNWTWLRHGRGDVLGRQKGFGPNPANSRPKC
jgi:hypothetical protein